ncbi:MAG TPA: class I SAM-dependent methyltransferase [Gaiellaceae bacterium]|nr:class I SAM-dependent methyltransferase [Gaiellaceae bacterium]
MGPVFSDAWLETFGRGAAEQTEREVGFLLAVLPPPPASVLDVPCGFGRHARALARRGYLATGVERNEAVAAEAHRAGLEVHVLDLRALQELPGSFDAVICMWASFGWFDDETNADVLVQIAEKTRPGGVVVLDVYDPVWFRAHQGPHEIDRGGRRVLEHKRVVGNRLSTTLDYEDGTRDAFEWRLYEPDELRALGAARGLDCERACAGFDLAAAPAGETARMQLVFRRR